MTNHHTNIDHNEIAKFSAFAQSWWDPKGPMKPLHELNPLRLAYIQKLVSLENKKVLDIGCGAGILTESLACAGAIATGIDMSVDAILAAKQHAQQTQLAVEYQQIETGIFAEENQKQFDVITCMEMLEHVPNPPAIIQAAAEMIKSGGLLFFSTINRNLKSFFSAIIGAEYILNLLPKGTHHYQQFIRPSELTQWAEQSGLVLKGLQGIDYHPFKHEFSFSDSVDVNYLVVFQSK